MAVTKFRSDKSYKVSQSLVEGDCAENGENRITIQYLNSGETYETTICYYRGRFLVSSWGDIVENV